MKFKAFKGYDVYAILKHISLICHKNKGYFHWLSANPKIY